MKIQFTLIYIFFYSFVLSQNHEFPYSYPLFLGNNGIIDSLVINKYTSVPKKFGDTVSIKELIESSFYKFNNSGFVTLIKKYSALKELKEEIIFNIKDNKVIQIIIKNYKELPFTKTLNFITYMDKEEIWTAKYKMDNNKYFIDSIKITNSQDSKTKEINYNLASSFSKIIYKYDVKGNLIYKKMVEKPKKITISYWTYDNNLLLTYTTGSYLSNLGSVIDFSFYKNINDSKGNWIERLAYNQNGKIKYIENQILYYKK